MFKSERRSGLLWLFAKQRPYLLSIAVVTRCCWEIVPIALPFLAGALVDSLSRSHEPTVKKTPETLASIESRWLLASMFALAGLAGLLAILRSISMAYAGRSLVSFARTEVARHMLSSGGLDNRERSCGAWLSLLQSDCAKLRGLLEKVLVRGLTSALRFIGPLLGMLAISWTLAIIIVLLWTVPFLLVMRLELQLRRLTCELRSIQDRFVHRAKQLIEGREALLGCGAQDFAASLLDKVIKEIECVQLRIARRSGLVQACLWFTAITSIAACWTMGSMQIQAGTLSVGNMVAFIGLLELAQRPVRSYARVARTLQSTSVAEERLTAAMRVNGSLMTQSLSSRNSAAMDQATNNSGPRRTVIEHPEVTKLSVTALDVRIGERLVIANLTHRFRSQSLTVVAGDSGCGKSTLLRVLAGLLPIEAGEVSIALQTHPRASDGLVLVPQQAWIFDGTLRENVIAGLAHPHADDLHAAATSSGLTSVLAEHNAGWDTLIGENGLRLSGGQLLRVAICRALLRRPAVLLLDEPTAGLDSESELNLLKQLKQLSQQTIIIMAAHRSACINIADEVLWLPTNRLASAIPNREPQIVGAV